MCIRDRYQRRVHGDGSFDMNGHKNIEEENWRSNTQPWEVMRVVQSEQVLGESSDAEGTHSLETIEGIPKLKRPWTLEEVGNLCMFFLLYLSSGLAWGFLDHTIFLNLISAKASPDQLAVLSFDRYTFLLKMFAAPLMDSYFSYSFGQRKTYIVPSLYIFGMVQIGASFHIEELIKTRNIKIILIANLVSYLALLVKDIGVNAWVLKTIRRRHMYLVGVLGQLSHHFGKLIGYNLCVLLHGIRAVSYTHLRAHETGRNLVCRLLLEKKKNNL
eukprot:TRINITY_DN12092_c0_g1_i2.p1 TRINITY_DN12092_c0_g1~~TRINITY_DN12092_c0_g1_i2.p1  ORF type:complete len:272 (+),score=43.51 TRINITY_DN12092_c0_g1_i2:64-879(+)